MSRASASSVSSPPGSRRSSGLDSMSDDQLFPLELSIVIKGLSPTSNPIVGMFGIDAVSGALNFLAHTELLRATGHPRFEKRLMLNYFPQRGQKVQFNVYSAPWRDDGVDNDICEEDRIGSVIVSLDKIPSLHSRVNFVPIKVELPLWHDTDPRLHQSLQRQGTAILIEFHAQEGMDTGPMAGPKSEMTYMESIAMMTQGAVFLKYRFSSNGKPQQRFVFYDKADGVMGSLYWCDVGKRKKDKDKCIPLHSVTGLFEETQTKAFKKFFKRPDPKQLEKCFSIVAKERTLDLEAGSKGQRDAFMYGIHKVLTQQGFGIKETDKQEEFRQRQIEEATRLMLPVRNTFEIAVKLRNLPIMPWSTDDTSSSIVALYEKQGQTFVLIEQTDWQHNNAMPNFSQPLLMPFTVPLQASIVKLVIYDHTFDEQHIVGSALVRTDTFQRYVGQEMLIKLRNHGEPAVDGLLTDNNTYMLLTAVIRQGDAREVGIGPSDPAARSGFNNVLGQLKTEIGGGGGKGGRGGGGRGGGGGGGYKSSFIKSITTFMGAGESFTLYPVAAGAKVPKELSAITRPTVVSVFYRPSSTCEHGQVVLVESGGKSEDELLDDKGMPLHSLFALPVTQLKEVLKGLHPPHFKGSKPNPDRSMTVLLKVGAKDDTLLCSLDLEARSKNVRDAWASGLSDFIAHVEEEAEGGDDEKLKFLEEKKGKLSALDAAKRNKLQGDSDIAKEMGDRFGDKGGKLSKGKWADDSDEEDEGKRKAKVKLPDPVKVDLEPPILGDGDVPPPPPMDMVFGTDGVPLAPPPPGAPGFTVAAPVWKGPKLKKLHWEALDGINVDGTLWGLVQGDLEDEAGALLEQLFKVADAKKKPEDEEAKEKVRRVYDGKRAQNIEILLKSFRMPVSAIQDAIVGMDMTILTQERLQILLTCCPTMEEAGQLKAYRKKNPELEAVGQAELFGYALLEVPKVTMRLRLLLFQTKFDGLVKEMIDTYQVLLTGANVLHESERLKKVMRAVLSVGNYLNQSTRKKAVGFRLQALEKLNDTKSTDNKQTLLDFIIDYMERQKAKEQEDGTYEESQEERMQHDQGDDEKEERKTQQQPAVINGEKQPPLSYLADLIPSVHSASLIDWKALNEERENLFIGLEELDKELQSMGSADDSDEHDQFRVVMQEFLGHAHRRVGKLKRKYEDVNDETTNLIHFFGESSRTMETTELFKIFDRFFSMYKQAEINGFNKREQDAKKERLQRAREEAQRLKEAKGSSKGLDGHPTQEEKKPEGENAFGVTLRKRPSVTEEQKAQQRTVEDAIQGKTKHVPTLPVTRDSPRGGAAPGGPEP